MNCWSEERLVSKEKDCHDSVADWSVDVKDSDCCVVGIFACSCICCSHLFYSSAFVVVDVMVGVSNADVNDVWNCIRRRSRRGRTMLARLLRV